MPRLATIMLCALLGMACSGCGLLERMFGTGDDANRPAAPPAEPTPPMPEHHAGTVTCPVDGAEVPVSDGVAYVHKGTVYFYCSQRCLDAFVQGEDAAEK